MRLIGIASRMGITSSSLENLIAGEVPTSVASKLKTISSSLQEFVDGGTSVGLASFIGCTSSNLQDLRNQIGREGTIGFLIGLCMESRENK